MTAVGPGFIETPMVEKALDAEALEAVEGLHPVGRLGESVEVAGRVTAAT